MDLGTPATKYTVLAKYNLQDGDCEDKGSCSGRHLIETGVDIKTGLNNIIDSCNTTQAFIEKAHAENLALLEQALIKDDYAQSNINVSKQQMDISLTIIQLSSARLRNLIDKYVMDTPETSLANSLLVHRFLGLDALVAIHKSLYISSVLTSNAYIMKHKIEKTLYPVYKTNSAFIQYSNKFTEYLSMIETVYKSMLDVCYSNKYMFGDTFLLYGLSKEKTRYNTTDILDDSPNSYWELAGNMMSINDRVQSVYREFISKFFNMHAFYDAIDKV